MSPYKSIKLEDRSPFSEFTSLARTEVLNDVSSKEAHMISWYQKEKWTKNNFNFSTVARDSQKNLIAISSCKVMPDETLKMLCHYYVMRNMRHVYLSISQTDFIPHYVEYAKKHCLKSVWFSIHCFDVRRERLKQSVIRSLNGGKLDLKCQPYVNSFKYQGQITYNHVKQHKFIYKII